MRNFFFYLFLQCFNNVVFAQQTPISSFYRYNWQILNPAAVDNEYVKNIGITGAANGASTSMISSGYRQNILGVDKSQFSFYVASETRLARRKSYKHKALNTRVGGLIAINNIANFRNYTLKGNFAYQINFDRRKNLNIGINAGLDYGYLNNINDAKFRDPNELTTNRIQIINPAFALGLFYSHERFHFGFSMPELYQKSAIFSTFTANYEGQYFEPSVAIRYLPKLSVYAWNQKIPVSADLNFRYHHRSNVGRGAAVDRDKIYFGIGYGTANVLNFEFGRFIPAEGIRNNSLRIGISAGVSLLGKNGIGNFFELNSLLMI
jgi:hypothetical protein